MTASYSGHPLFAPQSETELVPGELRVYRTWDIDAKGRLTSNTTTHVWSAQEEAFCLQLDSLGIGRSEQQRLNHPDSRVSVVYGSEEFAHGPAPVAQCACGIYGWYDPYDTRLVTSWVFGAIAVSGRVILGSNGVRAQKARILALSPYPDLGDALISGMVSEQFSSFSVPTFPGVPTYRSMQELLVDFPPEDVSGLGVTPQTDDDLSGGKITVAAGAVMLISGMVSVRSVSASGTPYLRINVAPNPNAAAINRVNQAAGQAVAPAVRAAGAVVTRTGAHWHLHYPPRRRELSESIALAAIRLTRILCIYFLIASLARPWWAAAMYLFNIFWLSAVAGRIKRTTTPRWRWLR